MRSVALLIIALSLATTVLASGEDANYWLAQTQSDYQNGSYSLAVQDIDEYLAIKPDDTWAWSFRANILLKMKRYSEAVDSFDELIKLDGSNDQAHNDRALILSGGMRQNDEALESLEKALEIEQKNANYWFNKGIILEAMKRSDEALQAYEQATSLDPSLEKAWYQQGVILAMKGSYDPALSSLERAIDLNSQNADAWNTKGLVLLDQNLPQEAEVCFERAAAIVPSIREFQDNVKRAQEEMEAKPNKVIEFNRTT